MDTYKPLLTNLELKALCKLAERSANTPLAQARSAHKAIAKLKTNYRPTKVTVEDRMVDQMTKQVAALKQSVEN